MVLFFRRLAAALRLFYRIRAFLQPLIAPGATGTSTAVPMQWATAVPTADPQPQQVEGPFRMGIYKARGGHHNRAGVA